MNLEIGPFNHSVEKRYYKTKLDFAIFCSIEQYQKNCVYTFIDKYDNDNELSKYSSYTCHSIRWSNQSTLEHPQLNLSFKTAAPDNMPADAKVYVLNSINHDKNDAERTMHYIKSNLKGTFLMPFITEGHFIGICIEYDKDKGSKVSFFDPFGKGDYTESIKTIGKVIRAALGNNIQFKQSSIKIQNDGINCGPWVFLFIEKAIGEIIQNENSVYDHLDDIALSINTINPMSVRKKHNALVAGLVPTYCYASCRLKPIFDICTSKDSKWDEHSKVNNVTLTIDDQLIFDKGQRVKFCEKGLMDKIEELQNHVEINQADILIVSSNNNSKSHNSTSYNFWTRFFPKSTHQSSTHIPSTQQQTDSSALTAACLLILVGLGGKLKMHLTPSKHTNPLKQKCVNAKILIFSTVMIGVCLFCVPMSVDKKKK